MKTFTRLFFLLLVLVPAIVTANVIVRGHVKYANGSAVVGWPVHITGDSALVNAGGCYQRHTVFTNALGMYLDTLLCPTNMTKVSVWMVNCNGAPLRKDYTLTTNQNVESNFAYCDSSVYQCVAHFTWQSAGAEIRFFSGASTPYNPASDSIVARIWTFGDGTSLGGNVINPVHSYMQSAAFYVCLRIRTAAGCEKLYCQTVQVTANTLCTADFTAQRIDTTGRFRFNSLLSSAGSGDSIISRKWRFGDGDTLTGNTIAPEHTYAQYGTYTVCLSVKTAQNCERTFCQTIVLQNTITSCHALFYPQFFGLVSTGYSYKFIGGYSTVTPGDSIILRQWRFGDGTTGTGLEPFHTYANPGTYTVCLNIQSLAGCRSDTCQTITIYPAHCEAIITQENITMPAGGNSALRYTRFNSSSSHGVPASDSITDRTWNFGDGTALVQGNTVNPIHGYAQGGPYNACLYILTQSGCRDTICRTIVVPPALPDCEPRFTTAATALRVVFNGSSASAPAGDSIISRTWTFGDSTGVSNAVVVTHQYAYAGTYNACLTIRTRLGCIKTWCKRITVNTVAGNCVPFFTKEQITTPRTIRFNSLASYSQLPNDTIIRRKWEFGNGQILDGNVVNPLHTYNSGGTYNVCLTIYTRQCNEYWCQTVQVLPLQTAQGDSLRIVNLYPVPVNTQLNAVVYSGRPNVNAELAIYDVYGIRKWYQTVVLPQSNSTYNIVTSQLTAGPYIFKVTTPYGIRSRSFYKIN